MSPASPAGPGKTTLTQLYSTTWSAGPPPRSAAGPAPLPCRTLEAGEPGAGARRPPAVRVADATGDKAKPNAVLKVLVMRGDGVIQQWQSKARWEGPLPRQYTATRAGAGWRWDNAEGKSIRVQTNERGAGGTSVEAWASASADRIVVHAQALDDVTIDADAEADARAPGHARDPRDAGDGSTAHIAPGGKGTRTADHARHGAGSRAGDGTRDGGDSPERAGDFPSSAADEKLVDAFEHELGIDLGDEAADGDGGEAQVGKGEAGGDLKGRTGDDTRRGGTGPGGPQAKPDGEGKGSEDRNGSDGSEGGSRDGKQGGDAEGMYGGEGKHGDGGVPSAVALFGGLVSVPAALRGFVELALIVASGDVTGAGSQLFERGLGKIASAAAARKMIAHEARLAALRETKLAIRRIATDKKTASAWAKATLEEQKQTTRIIYWELQRKYFNGYLDAAKRAKAEAKAALRKAPRSTGVQQRLEAAEMAEEAATVQPVAGRLPQNHEFAGKQFPSDLLPPAYRKQGLRFTDTGFPDFEPYAMKLPNGKNYVEIRYTGTRQSDVLAANAKAGYTKTPRGHTWHHSEELGRMQLVPIDLHDEVRHTGGVATYRHVTGDVRSYGK